MKSLGFLLASVLLSVALFFCKSGSTGEKREPDSSVGKKHSVDTVSVPASVSVTDDFDEEYFDSLSDGAKNQQAILSSIVNGDKKRFASLCTYPIHREYPLHDIENAEQMEAYFDVMFDKNFRKKVGKENTDTWGDNGYRREGFTNGDLWVSDFVYEITYSSPIEQMLRDSLVERERSSLHKSLREKMWNPFFCYRDLTDNSIMRIDMNCDSGDLRLAKYTENSKSGDIPEMLFSGSLFVTPGCRYYEFYSGNDSIHIEDYINSSEPSIDSDDDTIEMEFINGRMTEHHYIKKCYWLDEMSDKTR